MSFTPEEISEFKAEAFELLEVAEKSVLALDLGADFQPAYDSIFRGFHNLKGAAGMMELLALQAHTHELENLLISFKEKKVIPKEYLNLFLRGIDAARLLLNDQTVNFDFSVSTPPIEKPKIRTRNTTQDAISDSAFDEFIAETEEIIDRISNTLQMIETNTYNKETIESLYRDIHSLKGSSYLFSYNTLGNIAHIIESSLEGVRNGSTLPTVPLLNALFKCLQVLEAEVSAIKNKTPDPAIEALIPTLAEALETASLPGGKSQNASLPTLDTKSITTSTQEKESENSGTIRVSVPLLENLMTLMGEMVLVRNQILQFSTKSDNVEFVNLSKKLSAVTGEIQENMMKTRMQPIGNVLTKFHRVVRDLSLELKKEISLTLIGAETELDKSLLEAIKDPLTHIVRNSCDHGIENPETRLKAKKPKAGTLQIRSYHEGGQVVIEVTDDGKGLQREAIQKKAIEKGLIHTTQAQTMSEKETFNLIFTPGFSTAATVTNVSGRGVGMDVVRTNVEKIGGSVELSSMAGQSTTTKIKIPLTLAIVPALIVKSGGGSYAIPQLKLEELVLVDPTSSENKIEYIHGAPVYRLRGKILPLVELNSILGLAKASINKNSSQTIAVVNADHCSFGIIVDEVLDSADIVVKPINRLLKSLQAYSGATILGDGSIALILDIAGIAKIAQLESKSESLKRTESRASHQTKNQEDQEFLIVRLNSPTKHAIVLSYVHRLEEFKASQVEHSGNQRVIRYGNVILPLISLNQQLSYTGMQDIQKETISVVVIQKTGTLYGLEVNDIIDTLASSGEAAACPANQKGIYGNLNTPEELIVVLDPYSIIEGIFPQAQATENKSLGRKRQDTPVTNDRKNLKILLVEDGVFFRKTISTILSKEGHEIQTAIDGKQAIDDLEQNNKSYDLIISDIEMPRMNGFEFAKAVRENPRFSSVPMLALSSRAEKDYIEEGYRAGFNLYLEKLKPDVLLQAIDTLMTNKRDAA